MIDTNNLSDAEYQCNLLHGDCLQSNNKNWSSKKPDSKWEKELCLIEMSAFIKLFTRYKLDSFVVIRTVNINNLYLFRSCGVLCEKEYLLTSIVVTCFINTTSCLAVHPSSVSLKTKHFQMCVWSPLNLYAIMAYSATIVVWGHLLRGVWGGGGSISTNFDSSRHLLSNIDINIIIYRGLQDAGARARGISSRLSKRATIWHHWPSVAPLWDDPNYLSSEIIQTCNYVFMSISTW